jgi:murein DD-endopeptidase MepM/ murein hydrolase activator NlpD
MKQQYFILVLAHSLHGRLRRIHVPHKFVYAILALALLGFISLLGLVSSYARMAWKVANYNSLREEVSSLRERYQLLQRSSHQTQEQLASLQLFANEVSIAYGIKKKLEGPADISGEGRLVPTFRESLEEYQALRQASFSRLRANFSRRWHSNVVPSLWPIDGRLLSSYGNRTDPFHGDMSFHSGVDISCPVGTPVKSAGDGIVTKAEWSSGYGRLIIVDHGRGMATFYAHLARFDVIPGQEVRRGQIIAYSGASGRVTSPHLHYEVRQGGVPMNPYKYLARSSVAQEARRDFPF